MPSTRFNGFFGFRCTREEQDMMDSEARKKGGRRQCTLELYNNAGFIDKKALAELFKALLEPRVAKRMITKYCGMYGRR